MLLSMNWRNEVKKRLSCIDEIQENLIDAVAELGEVEKRDPLVKTKAASEGNQHNTGSCNEHIAVKLERRETQLYNQIMEYKTIINDYNKGWRTLSKDEKQVLNLRFKKGNSQEDTSKVLGYDVRTIRRIESEALRKMELHMLKY